jgi:hypothetical protein
VFGVALLLLLGQLAFAFIAPPLQRAHKIERAVRAQYPKLTEVSCRQLNALDQTRYSCSAKHGPRTACISVTGNVDHPVIDVGYTLPPRGVQPSC